MVVFCYATNMNKNKSIKPLFAILLTICLIPIAESNSNTLPDLSTARLNPECNQLLSEKAAEAGFNQGLCLGIIMGVEDNAHYDKKICVPNKMGTKDRLSVVKNYIATQPKRMNEAYASLVFDALFQQWPCPPK